MLGYDDCLYDRVPIKREDLLVWARALYDAARFDMEHRAYLIATGNAVESYLKGK